MMMRTMTMTLLVIRIKILLNGKNVNFPIKNHGLIFFAANKVMRMGSFAFRATQFFENLGKKSSNTKRRSTSGGSLGSPTDGDFR
jgi:hypothetical protein